jgi:thiamine-monophosphate kinase
MLVADRHFRAEDPADLVGRKALRVNLSDLAAMGAEPRAYMTGLAVDQERFGLGLLGGDIVGTAGPATISVTMIGEIPKGAALRRNGARPGDEIYVTGTIGDGAAGLAILRNMAAKLEDHQKDALRRRYLLPEPRLEAGIALRVMASAALDISDGLIADLGHMAETSGADAIIRIDQIPVSDAARAALRTGEMTLTGLLAGGDDYELLFAASPDKRAAIAQASSGLGLDMTRIGTFDAGRGRVVALDAEGSAVDFSTSGFKHF